MKRRYRRDPCLSHVAHWIASQGRRYPPDKGQAMRFLERLDSAAGFFSFRTFSDTEYSRSPGYDPLEKAVHGTLDACWDRLVTLNRQGAVVSVTINRTNGVGRGLTDIHQVRALFVDDDRGGDPGRFPLEPHIQVETSPGHHHFYWLVQGLPLRHFSSYQQRLAKEYQGDTRVQVLNQSMQLPGFWRRKSITEPRLPVVLAISGHDPYRYCELGSLIMTD
ncbi:MAG: RepB family DNA primase [Candidatus Thiodiazotropha sp. (ex. Lucinisca nassula)]|nr:RepB family DNA primase [Candidatus Thiodiazotropha sp. (ex. Lucinisca nassula)]